MIRPYQMCTRCIMDTTDLEIKFDEQGICNHCHRYEKRLKEEVFTGEKAEKVLRKAARIAKERGKNKKYDCVLGVSGGVDSTTLAYHAKKLGLRILAVHLDNGWNSELAVSNIEKTLKVLEIDLYTHVIDWEEFKDLQLAFLKASVANAEIPTDHAITALLYYMAARIGTRYILSGANLVTECILPDSWMYYAGDLRHLLAIHKRFGNLPLRTFPTMSLFHWGYYTYIKGVRFWRVLNYVPYNKNEAKKMIQDKLGWRDYGGKHYESIYTRFFQAYILPRKFNIDKRKAHLSTLICSGQMKRDEALEEMKKPVYSPELLKEDREYVIKKFGLTERKFEEIMKLPVKSNFVYPSNAWLYKKLRFLVEFSTRRATSV